MWKSDCIGCMHKVYLHYAWACVFWESELVSKNIHTGHKQKAFCHCALVCAFWDGDALCYWSHAKGLSPLCIILCVLRFEAFSEKNTDVSNLWQPWLMCFEVRGFCRRIVAKVTHMRLLSLWFRMCRLSSKDVLKVWLHWAQLKGLSPEWINMCFLRSPSCLLEYSHRVQIKGL